MSSDASRPAGPAFDWSAWLRALGSRVRRVRQSLGLSQETLGRLAGCSQGAISRLEQGVARHTPMLVVARVERALRSELERLAGDDLGADERQLLERGILSDPIPIYDAAAAAAGADPLLVRVLTAWRSLPPERRPAFIIALRSAAEALRTG